MTESEKACAELYLAKTHHQAMLDSHLHDRRQKITDALLRYEHAKEACEQLGERIAKS